jgi:hypothetical protein
MMDTRSISYWINGPNSTYSNIRSIVGVSDANLKTPHQQREGEKSIAAHRRSRYPSILIRHSLICRENLVVYVRNRVSVSTEPE